MTFLTITLFIMAADLEQIAMDAAYQADRMDVYEQLSETRRRRLEATTSAIAAMKNELKDYADAKEVAQEAKLAAHEAQLRQITQIRDAELSRDISQLEAETNAMQTQILQVANDATTARLDLAKANLKWNDRDKQIETFKKNYASGLMQQESKIRETILALFRMADMVDERFSKPYIGNNIQDKLRTEFSRIFPGEAEEVELDTSSVKNTAGSASPAFPELLDLRLSSAAGAASSSKANAAPATPPST